MCFHLRHHIKTAIPAMKTLFPLLSVVFVSIIFCVAESKTLDPYKVLGIDRSASQRDIQKAFHKLSLQYHPDKNKNKGAQEKFAEINNAYDILSDEVKRKNYDLYGDDQGTSGFDHGSTGHGGYSYFTSGGPGQSGFSFRPGGWQNMGGQGGSKSFSFSFGGSSNQQSPFGFGLDDIFSNFFGGDRGGSQFGGFGGSAKSEFGGTRSSSKSIPAVNKQIYRKEIADKGITWLLLSYTSSASRGLQNYEFVVSEVAASLEGALKVGSINCDTEMPFCKELGIYPRRAPRVLVYSYRSSDSGTLVEYNSDLDIKMLKNFCQEHLPRFSKRVNLGQSDLSSDAVHLPKVMLLSTKKDTPVIWRALSGLYRKSFVFYDTEVHDVSDPMVRKLGVNALPAIVGWLSNGEKHILQNGISVKDLKSAIQDLSSSLGKFEKMNKKVASAKSKKTDSESGDRQIPVLAAHNFDDICGEKTPVCIIGAFRSSQARGKLENILQMVSQKSLSRRQNVAFGSDLVSYALLDATKQQSFLVAFDKSGFKSVDQLLVAYKPRKGKFATVSSEMTMENAEKFIHSVLNGDVQFTKTRQKPSVK